MPKNFISSLLLLLGVTITAHAQLGFSHEIGVIAGPVAFQSDYGERGDFDTNISNTGVGIGLVHYLNFAYDAECNCYAPKTYFNDHFKLRSELSFNKTNLKHKGEWTERNPERLFTRQLKAMRGETQVTNIGMQLEYFPKSLRLFSASPGMIAPFISLGGQFSLFSTDAYSEMGNGVLGQDPAITPVKYFNAFDRDGGSTWSVVGSVGARYKINSISDLMVDLRWQYYFSDWVDGLKPNPDVYTENKANDWLVWLNFGYIYYLD